MLEKKFSQFILAKELAYHYNTYMNKNEKIDRQVILMVQPSLYGKFKEKCKENYKTVSEVLREAMLEYIRSEDEVDK